MLVIVGESASGKSTTEKCLCALYGYKKQFHIQQDFLEMEKRMEQIITLYQWKILQKNVNGIFAEIGEYNGWFYGTAVEDCTNDKVAVLTPHGMRQLKNKPGIDVFCVYIKVPRKERLIKILQRGDNIEEAKEEMQVMLVNLTVSKMKQIISLKISVILLTQKLLLNI